MLIIPQCRSCNADKTTCLIKLELSKKLQKAGIKERLKYKCKEWQKHLKYKVGDKVVFHFIEEGERGGELSGETLTGIISDISKKKPIYMVVIDKENRHKIDKEYSAYDRFVMPCTESGDFEFTEADAAYFTVPVKESLIIELDA
jgi:hypothetical protein